MRKIILFIATSLDGLIATPSGGVDWLFTDQDYGYSDFVSTVDTVIMGRKTYEKVLEFGDYPYADMTSYVVTRSPSIQQPETGRIIRVESSLTSLVEPLKQASGKDIWLVGGGELVRTFLQQKWIDQMILSIHPVILGQGIPLFPPHVDSTASEPHHWFTLESTQHFDTGLVQISYQQSACLAESSISAPES